MGVYPEIPQLIPQQQGGGGLSRGGGPGQQHQAPIPHAGGQLPHYGLQIAEIPAVFPANEGGGVHRCLLVDILQQQHPFMNGSFHDHMNHLSPPPAGGLLSTCNPGPVRPGASSIQCGESRNNSKTGSTA